MKYCHHCGTAWEGFGQPGIRETCDHCGEDLHACLNCKLYDPAKPQHCQVETDPVKDSARANFCEEFVFASRQPKEGAAKPADTAAAREQWKALFKK